MVKIPKLSEQQKDEIKNRYAAGGVTIRQLASDYEVSHATITRVLSPDYVKRENALNKERLNNMRQSNQYNEQHVTNIDVSFHVEKDSDIIKHLDSIHNRTQYMRDLIKKDIGVID